MNTSWYDTYLSSEWDGWDENDYIKHGVIDKDIDLAWWVTGDIQNDPVSTQEILDIIIKAKAGINGEFWGNSYRVFFTKDHALLTKPMFNEEREYSISDVEQAVLLWQQKLNAKNL